MSRFQEVVEQSGQAINFDAGAHLFRQGDSDSRVFLVREGLLKAYYVQPDGREHIKSFLPEGSIIASMVALMDDGACTFSLAAVERSAVVALPYADLKQAASSDLDLANALVTFLSTYGKRKEQREYQLLSLSPEQRYELMLKSSPDLVERVSLADLAAHIGVTPQALSRIRRRMSRTAA